MLTRPVSQRQLCVAKALLAWLLVSGGANAVLVGGVSTAIGLLALAGAPLLPLGRGVVATMGIAQIGGPATGPGPREATR